MDKTSSPESLLWVISVVPKSHQTVFQQSHAPFIHYILLFTGQGYVCGEEATSAREKNNPLPILLSLLTHKTSVKKQQKEKADHSVENWWSMERIKTLHPSEIKVQVAFTNSRNGKVQQFMQL